MKTSHTSDELKRGGGSANRVPMAWSAYSIIYCMGNIKCDQSVSYTPKCPLNHGVSIVQKHAVKHSDNVL